MNLNMVMWKNSYFEEIHAEIFKVKSNRSLLCMYILQRLTFSICNKYICAHGNIFLYD